MPVAARRTLAWHDTFGHIPGVPVGTFWASRQECGKSRVHAPTVAGISGSKEKGAYSIVLSGVTGYEDDVDEGDRIIYTGSGGKAKGDRSRTGPQTQDQSFSDPRNAALLKSRDTGNPVRVVRGAELRSDFAPPGGDCKYRYDGLYTVTNAWLERGRAGYTICRFELQRLPEQPPVPIRGSTHKGRSSSRRRRDRDFTPIPEPKFEGIPIPTIPHAGPSSTTNMASTSGQASKARPPVASSLPVKRTVARPLMDKSFTGTTLRPSDSASAPSSSHPVHPRRFAQGVLPARVDAMPRQIQPQPMPRVEPPSRARAGGSREQSVPPSRVDASASAAPHSL
ncbi:hypothetical protein FOMPIDRAFT_1026584 [Fomitopsis schrenkii]|uniref:YDG domain-containing protein n=1 Tax=Fomitopsis schrenkii TaxID=2126942 RepID=S8F2Y5_FOMSC|nr:hypothetical protein FOMPIDRAFT_1026584 [Fomitopsis schrenkii]